MPIYKYECEACGHVFEDLRGFNDPNPDECPACEHAEVRRLISGGNFLLKGGGWYATEYGSSGASAPATSTEPADSEGASDSSSEGCSDGTEAA